MKTVYVILAEDDPYCPLFPAYDIVFASESDAFEFLMSEYEDSLFIDFNKALHCDVLPEDAEARALRLMHTFKTAQYRAEDQLELREIRPFTLAD